MDDVVYYPGVQLHDVHPYLDLGNQPNLTAQECAKWCCSREDCVCFYHTTSQPSDDLDCVAGYPCCWLKPTFNATRLDDDGDFERSHPSNRRTGPSRHSPPTILGHPS